MMYPKVYEMKAENKDRSWALELAMVLEAGLPHYFKVKVWNSGNGFPLNLAFHMGSKDLMGIQLDINGEVLVKGEDVTLCDFLCDRGVSPKRIGRVAFFEAPNNVRVYESPYFSALEIGLREKRDFVWKAYYGEDLEIGFGYMLDFIKGKSSVSGSDRPFSEKKDIALRRLSEIIKKTEEINFFQHSKYCEGPTVLEMIRSGFPDQVRQLIYKEENRIFSDEEEILIERANFLIKIEKEKGPEAARRSRPRVENTGWAGAWEDCCSRSCTCWSDRDGIITSDWECLGCIGGGYSGSPHYHGGCHSLWKDPQGQYFIAAADVIESFSDWIHRKILCIQITDSGPIRVKEGEKEKFSDEKMEEIINSL